MPERQGRGASPRPPAKRLNSENADRDHVHDRQGPSHCRTELHTPPVIEPRFILRLNLTRNGSSRVDSASAIWVWNFTASAPASAAASTKAWAVPRDPSWACATSAIRYAGASPPMGRPEISNVLGKAITLCAKEQKTGMCQLQTRADSHSTGCWLTKSYRRGSDSEILTRSRS